MGHEVTMSKIAQDQHEKRSFRKKKKENMVHLPFLTPAMAA